MSTTNPLTGSLNSNFSIEAFAVDGDTVITSGYFETRMLKTDKIFKSLFFTEITVSKGKIVKYRLLEDSFALVLALS
ncbi:MULTISPECIES: nuclear transport factor 2 family protein [Dyadobacter]|uniref:SnoaL-like domain-containing protein n=1 Tax=Dyadobacter chenhuakuii TaxID=2909339 RepID=A0A9X1QEA2_9BACT|nr:MULTISPECIES: hypothetical protein [Dyadobacter]MCF2498897.1 hypothetical protein [Dyadobacter chenhuakuii]MCF2517794.1 hypothetical protein [Dyadobacter sp. CY351]